MLNLPFWPVTRAGSSVAPALLMLGLIFAPPNLAHAGPSEAQLYAQAVAAREQQDFAAAARLFEAVLRLNPRNTDAYVLLGYSHLALEDGPKAQAAFEAALKIAPDYQDARLGLAQLAFRQENRPRATQLVEIVLAAQPDRIEALALRDRLAAPPPPKWRLDIGEEYHRLTAGRPAWREAITTLSYRLSPDTVVSGTLRHADRGTTQNTQISARLSHRVSPKVSFFGLIGATPDPDFLPEVVVGLGGQVRVWASADERAAFWVRAQARAEFGQNGRVDLTRLGPQLVLFGGDMVLSADWLHGQGENGLHSDGFMARLEGRLSERLVGVIGYADAPEIDSATVIDTQSAFVGLSYKVDDTLTLRATIAREKRAAYDRETLFLGLTKRF
ncbi:YaiO family outer membrane beta-barrel protein [Rhodobacter sp. TJ_12]|uniref:YaiO family outer membrane beta-barrel protein n=1 Tax=Rhodobacter sp. TJ_12 TaxID=2029399 RepID=UPI001CBCD81A|nr:YaiO family outer membrane beta-barrel protein [Rhodobacter sp. TJ_12]